MLDDFGSPSHTAQNGLTQGGNVPDRRTQQRHIAVMRVAKLITATGQELCLIKNISTGGLMAHVYVPHATGEQVSIEFKAGHGASGRIAWSRYMLMGVEFDQKVNVSEILSNTPLSTDDNFIARSPRIEVRCQAKARVGAHYHRIEVCDISQGGAKIAAGDGFSIGDELVLTLDGLPPWPGIVRWLRDGHAGVSFNMALPLDQLATWAAGRR